MSNASAHLIRGRHLRGLGHLFAYRRRAVRQADERHSQVAFSNSLRSGDWGETTIAAGDLAEAITRLKHERSEGYLLAHGGTRFARSLVETGLIDEYRLVVHPVVLGAGERIFSAPLTIETIGTTVFSRAAVAHVFAAHP